MIDLTDLQYNISAHLWDVHAIGPALCPGVPTNDPSPVVGSIRQHRPHPLLQLPVVTRQPQLLGTSRLPVVGGDRQGLNKYVFETNIMPTFEHIYKPVEIQTCNHF